MKFSSFNPKLLLLFTIILLLSAGFLTYRGYISIVNEEPSVLDAKISGKTSFVVRPRYQHVTNFQNGTAAVKLRGLWGFIDRQGNWLVDPSFEAGRPFHQGRAAVKDDGKWGFINRSGEWVVEPNYGRARDYSGGRSAVKKEGEWGYLDRNGDTLTEFRFASAKSFSAGRAVVSRKDGKKAFINTIGETITRYHFTDAQSFGTPPFAPVEKFDLWGYLNRSGEIVVDHRFQWASPFYEDIARVLQRGEWEYLHKNGTRTPGLDYDSAHNFSNGLSKVIKGHEVGFVDTGLQERLNTTFSNALSFREGLAPAKKDGLWGYVDKTGEWVLPPTFEAAARFHEGTAAVKTLRGWGYIPHPNRNESTIKTHSFTSRKGIRRVRKDNLSTSLTSKIPRWRYNRTQQYLNLGIGLNNRHWNVKFFEENRSYGESHVTYETTGFPYEEATAYHLEAARDLYWRTRQAARQNGWFNFQNARSDGFGDYAVQNDHYLNKEYILDNNVLVPSKPEVLIFKNIGGTKKLAGVMYHLKSDEKNGPQIGGPLTTWHYHVYQTPRCFRKGKLLDSRASTCENGEWRSRSNEMIHVWFLDHPQGSFATRMDFPPGSLPDYSTSFHPRNR